MAFINRTSFFLLTFLLKCEHLGSTTKEVLIRVHSAVFCSQNNLEDFTLQEQILASFN